MLTPLHISWKDPSGANIYRGAEWSKNEFVVRDLAGGVLQPDSYSEVFTVVMQNPAQERRMEAVARDGQQATGIPEKFVSVKLYLDAEDDALVDMLVHDWPAHDAGVELSFDQGVTWRRIDQAWGNPLDPSTWIPLPAVVAGAPAGELGAFPPFNRCLIQLRIKTPAHSASFGMFKFELAVDFDVL